MVSLFTGCGGMDLGFEAAGFATKAMVEIAPYCAETLRNNFCNARVLGPPDHPGDVRDISSADLSVKGVDLLIGGPPCQSFSIAAAQRFLKGDAKFKRIGFADSNRGSLIHEYLKVLERLRPRAFVIENVPGLKDLDGGAQLGEVLLAVKRLGYAVATPTVVQAAQYGVPQFRQRLIIMGARGKIAPTIPSPTHTDNASLLTQRFLTVAEALASFPGKAKNHLPREHLSTSIARYKRLEVGKREHLGRVDRLDPYRPSKTVIAGGMNGGGRSHLHPFLARTLTVRECARLQTFPDSFEFAGNMSRQFTQVGNAVPPLLAEVLSRSLAQQFFDLSYDGPPQFSVNPAGRPVSDCVRELLKQARREREYMYEDIA